MIEKNVLHERCKCGNSWLKYCCSFHGLTKTAVSCTDLWPLQCAPWTFTIMYTQRNVIKYQNTHIGTLFYWINLRMQKMHSNEFQWIPMNSNSRKLCHVRIAYTLYMCQAETWTLKIHINETSMICQLSQYFPFT